MGACGPPGASRCGVYPAKRGLVPRCALLPAPTPRDALSAVGTPSGRSLRNLECTGWAKPHQAGGRRGKEREARNEPTLRGVDYAATGGGGRSAPEPNLLRGAFDRNVLVVDDGLDGNHVAAVKDPHPTPAPAHGLEHLQAFG